MVKNKSQLLIRLNRSILPDCIIRLSSPFPLVICRPVMPLILIPIFDEELLIRRQLPIIKFLSFLSTQMRLHSKLRRASVSVEVDMLLAGFQLQEEVVMVVLRDMLVLEEEEDSVVLEVVEVDLAILVDLVDQEVEITVVLVAITLAHPVDTAPLAVLALQMDLVLRAGLALQVVLQMALQGDQAALQVGMVDLDLPAVLPAVLPVAQHLGVEVVVIQEEEVVAKISVSMPQALPLT